MVYSPLRLSQKGQLVLGLFLVMALFFSTVGTLLAGTTGGITGTVTDSNGTPVAGVTVNAVSPTGSYTAKTDSKGFYSFAGVNPDTYTVSFQLSGYQPTSIQNVNVFADQTANAPERLQKSLRTIAQVTARSNSSAFQPNQTVDTYSVGTKQIQQQLGKTFNPDITRLIISLPGASLDASGYPILRGGRETDEGFQFEGIDYTDAFTHQFVGGLLFNGASEIQLTPGAGDASIGNVGTGAINILTKRGTYPPFGTLDLEQREFPYAHQLGLEYGFATPNGRFSNYVSFLGIQNAIQYGALDSPAGPLGVYLGGFSEQNSRQFVDNLVYKFGRNNNQSLQALFQTTIRSTVLDYGGIKGLNFPTADPYTLANLNAFTGLTTAQIQQIVGLSNAGQTAVIQPLNHKDAETDPNETYKFQYSNNLDASTFVTAKFYRVHAVSTFDYPFEIIPTDSFSALQGGIRTGVALDGTKQANSNNLITFGGKYEFLHPVYDQPDNILGLLAAGGFGNGFETFDFLPANDPDCVANGEPCGYLKQFPSVANNPVPSFNEHVTTQRHDYAGYVTDTITPNDRFKLSLGVRLDGEKNDLPSTATGLYLPANANAIKNATAAGLTPPAPVYNISKDVTNPLIVEPRANFSYQLTRNDAVRGSYGRSVQFTPISDIDNQVDRSYYNAYNSIPSYNNFTGKPATYCGILSNMPCANYGDQLFWENQIGGLGVGVRPALPETINNFDFSYEHQFPGNVAVKVTPFYSRGYNVVALTASNRTTATGAVLTDANGIPQLNPATVTNDGISRTTGVEFLLTKDSAYGLSGSLSATYINELSNVVPLTASEDFFPTIPGASLQLGDLYRVGFVTPLTSTLALSFRSRANYRINPILTYTRGYPLGAGLNSAAFVNGAAYNVPNTNIVAGQTSFGTTGAPQYVDPQNPGTYFKPNIAATRGTAETSAGGGILSSPRLTGSFTFEYDPPNSHSTFGVLVSNIFGNIYGRPVYNSRYQPVATGISGPKTGYSGATAAYGATDPYLRQYGPLVFGNQPYIITPNGGPTSIRFYYQLGL